MTDRTIDTKSEVADVLTFRGEFADSFEFLVTKRQQLQIELPSTYDALVERFRLEKGGSRVPFSDAGFTDSPASYDLEVAAGETYRWSAREAPRYIPNNDAVVSLAHELSDSLENGDQLVAGQGTLDLDVDTPTGTGWVIVYDMGSSLSIDHKIISQGTEQSNLSINTDDLPPLTQPIRYSDQHNLYNVGGHDISVFYTDTDADGNDIEVKTDLGTNAVQNDFAVDEFNLRPFYELSVGSGNNTKTLRGGTIVHSPLADVDETATEKTSRRTDYQGPLASDGTLASGFDQTTYTPFLALQIRPGEGNVYTELVNTRLAPANAGEVQVKLFYDDQVTFTGGDSWGPPRGLTSDETVLEERRDIDTFVDADGNSVSSDARPGGGQIDFVSSDTGTNQGGKNQGQGNSDAKAAIHPDGIAIAFKRNDSADGGTDTFQKATREFK